MAVASPRSARYDRSPRDRVTSSTDANGRAGVLIAPWYGWVTRSGESVCQVWRRVEGWLLAEDHGGNQCRGATPEDHTLAAVAGGHEQAVAELAHDRPAVRGHRPDA